MKKSVRIILSALLVASLALVSALVVSAANTGFVTCEVTKDSELIDNSETNDQASGFALCYAEAYGTGRTTQGDCVAFRGVKFDKKVTQLAVKCGYNLGGDKAGTGTEFWVYLNKIEGEPIAKLAVNDSETKSSQIVDQIYKYADVTIEPGTYDVFVVGETEYSGSFSEVDFIYDGEKLNENWKAEKRAAEKAAAEAAKQAEEDGFYICQVTKDSELIDNSETNDQASGFALCYAEAYGTGRTTQGDCVAFRGVTLAKKVNKLAVKCGYNLGGDKAGTGTEFWVYLDKIEGEPIAKLAVNDSETKSSQIVDQVYKYADVAIEPGTYDFLVVGETEYSGSFSELALVFEGSELNENWKADKRAAEKAAEEAKKAEEEAKKKAEEAAEKAAEEAKEAEEKAEEKAEEIAETAENAVEEAKDAAKKSNPALWIILAVVAVAAIIGGIVAAKKKKQ